MSKTRSWWLAFLVSIALHGAVVAALYCWPSRRIEGPAAPHFVAAVDLDGGSNFVVMEQTGKIPSAPPAGLKFESPVKPVAASKTAPLPARVSSGPNTVGRPPSSTSPKNGTGWGQGSPAAATSFFNVLARGQTIVYLIDGSASMGPSGALEAAQRELLASVRRLPASARFQIIVYNKSSRALLPRWPGWLNPTPDIIRQVEQALNDSSATGSTDHRSALHRALAMQPDVLFFLTDAGDVSPDLPGDIARRNLGRTVIHVIEMIANDRLHGDSPLQHLARHNRGTYQAVNLSE